MKDNGDPDYHGTGGPLLEKNVVVNVVPPSTAAPERKSPVKKDDKDIWRKDKKEEEPEKSSGKIDPKSKNALLFHYQVAVVKALQEHVNNMDASRGPVFILKAIQDAVNETTRVISWLYGQREEVPAQDAE